MNITTRRDFFRNIFAGAAALSAAASALGTRRAEAAPQGKIVGVCLYVPTLGKAEEFVETMNRNAPGQWQAHPLQGPIDERYFQARELYELSRGKANTFVGVVDPATFQVVHEAIVGSGGTFHYVSYDGENRVNFSIRL